MSPKLPITVLEQALKTLQWENKGISIDKERLHHLRYADNTVLSSNNLNEANNMLINELKNATQNVGVILIFVKQK